MRNSPLMRILGAGLATVLCHLSFAAEIELEIGQNRSADSIGQLMDGRVRQVARNLANLSAGWRKTQARAGRYHSEIPFSLPTTLVLKRNGARLAPSPFLGDGGSITLAFDASGPRAFDNTYKQFLIDTFTQAQSTIQAVFGAPDVGGTIFVRNYDADIGDRDAVAGGYYVPNNGSGEQEIRFPVYSNPEAAGVNFVHCLLLAYLGPNGYSFDAFKEGLVRAATMRVVRTAGAMPAQLDPQLIEAVLENTYDVGSHYDWYNQRGLGGSKFIAPNLRDVPLPPGGSLGGVYLLRYEMAGSAWQKVLVEYPAFASTLNQALYTTPSLAGDVPGLVAAAQSAINLLGGSGSATIEGYSFAEWFRRQCVLETRDVLGLKLICHPIPIPPESGSSDFGVFDVPVTWFETIASGNEVLLSGTSYPIFWTETFDRLFPSSQEDRMDIAGAYGSVTPNLPNLNSGAPYRVAVDIPVQDRITRVYLPAGAIATGSNTTPRDLYGTVLGVPSTGTLRLRLTYGATVVDNIPIQNFAFGTRINTSGYLGSARCRLEVIHTVGPNETVLIDRRVNKGPGPLGVDLRVDNGLATYTFNPSIPKGLSTIGFSVDPFSSSISDILGVPENEVLVARWNGSKAKYDIAPDTGPFHQGNGYFVRMPAAANSLSVSGRTSPNTPIAVALRPGWNLISNPLLQVAQTSDVFVVHASNAPQTYADSVGTLIGTTFFEFVPGPNDAATGAPETGTMAAAGQFQMGKAYFVRVLIAEGVTLLFRPSSSQARLSAVPTPPPVPSRFLMQVKVARQGHSTEARIGQSANATNGFDARLDSGLPPGSFGLQAAVEGQNLFTDVRAASTSQIFRVKFDGLIRGQIYQGSTKFLSGDVNYSIRPVGSQVWQRCRGPIDFNFRATSTTWKVEVKVEADR